MDQDLQSIGAGMYDLVCRLFPICRSITGDGVRETLRILSTEIPGLEIHEVSTGTKVFDWEVPREWNVRQAYVLDPDGEKIIDFADSNLHLVGYSIPVNKKVSLAELQEHLHSRPDLPAAIPYVTSYYREYWGFCLSHQQREKITKPGEYTVVIDSELKDGHLTYGEVRIPGERPEEIFFSTYICHPSMANNETSGPAVCTYLAKWLTSRKNRLSLRMIFVPETIGSITYLSRNLDQMKQRIVAGYNVTCVGDDRAYSFMTSRQEDSLADQAARHVLGHMHPDYKRYSWLDRGGDERQYCAPGVDLPVASVMRTKYHMYPEYHTSLDDLNLVSAAGLAGAYQVLCRCVECIEADERLKVTVFGEPQLGKRGLYPSLSTRDSYLQARDMTNLISYCDGSLSLLQIADKLGVPIWRLIPLAQTLKNHGLLITL